MLLLSGAACGRGAVHGPTPAKLSATGCSSINLVNGDYSVFGKNLDNDYTTGGLLLINARGVEKQGRYASSTGRRARWISRYASVSFCFVHVGFVWTGMNEHGLVISMMHTPPASGPPEDGRAPLPDGQWVEYMLDTCRTVQDVLEAESAVRIMTRDHYHVADAGGSSAVIEWIGGRKLVYTGDTLPVSVLTNSTYGESIADWQEFRAAPFPTWDGSLRRFRIAAAAIEAFVPSGPESAVQVAFDTLHSIRSERIYGLPNTTQWSLVFDTRERRAFFRTYSHPEIRFIDLDDLELWCDEPMQMLDIQRELSGDVSGQLEEITFEAACAQYRQFVESFQGREPADGEIEEEVSYYMSFPCVVSRSTPRRTSGRVR